jgi:hypothetical protein
VKSLGRRLTVYSPHVLPRHSTTPRRPLIESWTRKAPPRLSRRHLHPQEQSHRPGGRSGLLCISPNFHPTNIAQSKTMSLQEAGGIRHEAARQLYCLGATAVRERFLEAKIAAEEALLANGLTCLTRMRCWCLGIAEGLRQ